MERKQGSKTREEDGPGFDVIHDRHLGGCAMNGDGATYYPAMWREMIKKYNLHSVIDVGCGAGFEFDGEGTDRLRSVARIDREKYSPFYESHFIQRGLFFKNISYL